MSEAGAQEAASGEIVRQASVYVFPGSVRPPYPSLSSTASQPAAIASVPDGLAAAACTAFARGDFSEDEAALRIRRRPCAMTHARSASHGGVLAESLASSGLQANVGSYLGPLSAVSGGRPSALKKPGHQRAFSQGQVVDVQGHSVTGHSRVGSRTDFILPPGHREEPRPPTAGKTPSFRGHSRQASRYCLRCGLWGYGDAERFRL